MASTWTTKRSLHSGFKRSGADLVTTITSVYVLLATCKFQTKTDVKKEKGPKTFWTSLQLSGVVKNALTYQKAALSIKEKRT